MVVNLSGGPAQGLIRLPGADMHDMQLSLADIFSGTRYSRQADEIEASGLFVDLPAWGYHLFAFCIDGSAMPER